MEIHRSPRRMVAGDPRAASTCSQMASSAAHVVSRCQGPGAHRSPRWTLAQQRCRSRHQEGRSMREGGETPESPRRIGNFRRPRSRSHQEIVEEGTRGCAGTPNSRVGLGVQGVPGPFHQENLQVASGIGCVDSPSSGEPRASGEVGVTASSNSSHPGRHDSWGTSGEFAADGEPTSSGARRIVRGVATEPGGQGQDAVERRCASRCDHDPCIARRPPGHRRVDGFKKSRFAGRSRVGVSGRDLVCLKSVGTRSSKIGSAEGIRSCVAVHGGSDYSLKSHGIDESDAKRR